MIKNIHFIGIGGVSMSALAKLCVSNNMRVTGTDDVASAVLDNLSKLGIEIKIGHNERAVVDADIVVYTIAVGEHPDLLLSRSLNKTIYERAEFLAKIASEYSKVIAVSGTHGKTTTTALLGYIFKNAGLNPTIHLGGNSLDLGGNVYIGGKDIFITEACEYNRSFLKLRPDFAIITNIEADHLDTYKNMDAIYSAFADFCDLTQNKVVVGEDAVKNLPTILQDKLCTFGYQNGVQLCAKNIKQANAQYSFDVYYNDKKLFRAQNNLLGKHNILNVLACISMALIFGIDVDTIQSSISSFRGVERRLEMLGGYKNVVHYHDYAHHPTEIKNTISTLNDIKNERLICIFQPHTYTRTLSLMPEFCKCFYGVDYLVILPTYSAREDYIIGGDATDILYNLDKNVNAEYCSNYTSLKYILDKIVSKPCTICWLGAGDIVEIAQKYINNF